MGEKEKTDIHEIIDKGIKSSMVLIYWIIGIANGIVVLLVSGLVLPMYQDVSNHSIEISKKVDSNEAYQNFLTKGQYHYLQKEEHKYDQRAINNPTQCHDVYGELNMSQAEQLEIRFRGAETN